MANSSGSSNFTQWWDGLQVCGMVLISSAKADDYNFVRTHVKPATSSQMFLTKTSSTDVWEQHPYIVMEEVVEKKHASEGEGCDNVSRFPC